MLLANLLRTKRQDSGRVKKTMTPSFAFSIYRQLFALPLARGRQKHSSFFQFAFFFARRRFEEIFIWVAKWLSVAVLPYGMPLFRPPLKFPSALRNPWQTHFPCPGTANLGTMQSLLTKAVHDSAARRRYLNRWALSFHRQTRLL